MCSAQLATWIESASAANHSERSWNTPKSALAFLPTRVELPFPGDRFHGTHSLGRTLCQLFALFFGICVRIASNFTFGRLETTCSSVPLGTFAKNSCNRVKQIG